MSVQIDRRRRLVVPFVVAALFLSGCAAADEDAVGGAAAPTPSSATETPQDDEPTSDDAATADPTDNADIEDDAAGVEYPLTVQNCGDDVTFDAPPERVFMFSSEVVPVLSVLGVLDRVVSRAGVFDEQYYDEATIAQVEEIPSLAEDTDSSGHLLISQEVVLAEEPDFVIGDSDSITREQLAAQGIPAIISEGFCPEGIADPGFEDVYDLIETYGQIFDRTAEADAAIEAFRDRVSDVEGALGEADGRTAATLFPTIGGGAPSAYGTQSMTHAQMEAAGFENAFGDVDDRVFEVTIEELLDRDPDVLILLHVDGEPGPVEDAITSLPGAEGLTAVVEDQILTMLFNFGEPPSPLTLDGLERIAETFGS